jgi:hypothetical protein
MSLQILSHQKSLSLYATIHQQPFSLVCRCGLGDIPSVATVQDISFWDCALLSYNAIIGSDFQQMAVLSNPAADDRIISKQRV